jgi:hypothetical protein
MFDGERHLERFILNPVTGAVIRDDRRSLPLFALTSVIAYRYTPSLR